MIGYVYLTKNTVNGRLYVGSHAASEFDQKYYGSGTLIRRALKKHGKRNFKRKILYRADSREELIRMETHFIGKLKKKHGDSAYNLADDAERPMPGRKHSAENLALFSRQRSGSKNAMYGVHLNGEKNPMWGKTQSAETRKKISERLSLIRGPDHGNYGKIRTDEQKKKYSDNKKGLKIITDTIGEIIKENGIFYCEMPSSMKNVLFSYRAGVWQKEKTIKNNIERFCLCFGIEEEIENLLKFYVPNREYYGVSRCS
ncbi:MAG: NUMOD3 domain-containing DNA-binding protein [Candidatus Acidiferrales bacterium]